MAKPATKYVKLETYLKTKRKLKWYQDELAGLLAELDRLKTLIDNAQDPPYFF